MIAEQYCFPHKSIVHGWWNWMNFLPNENCCWSSWLTWTDANQLKIPICLLSFSFVHCFLFNLTRLFCTWDYLHESLRCWRAMLSVIAHTKIIGTSHKIKFQSIDSPDWVGDWVLGARLTRSRNSNDTKMIEIAIKHKKESKIEIDKERKKERKNERKKEWMNEWMKSKIEPQWSEVHL